MIGFNTMFSIDEVLKWNPMFNPILNPMLNGVKTPLNMLNGEKPLPQIAEKQTAAGQQVQDEILDACQKTMDQWYQRRCRTAEDCAEFRQKVLHVKNPQDFMKAWQHWTAGSMLRLAEDATDQVHLIASVASCCTHGSLAAMPDAGMPTTKTPSAAITRTDSDQRDASAAELH